MALPDRVPARVRDLADADGNQAFASAVAVWEIATKHARNKGRPDDMPINGQQALRLSEAAFIPLLDISAEHAAEVDHLPLHHADPFDRLLVAQARFEGMTLLTHDKTLARYGDFVMVV